MILGDYLRGGAALMVALLALPSGARGAEHVTLRNGSEWDCVRLEPQGDKLRLYFAAAEGGAEQNYADVPAEAVVSIEPVLDSPVPALAVPVPARGIAAHELQPTAAELTEMLARVGAQHHVDADLLASVVHAESGGRVRAVSRTGARGLMQLMPGTAAELGVRDSFAASENVQGGTTYLDGLLARYHDNIALALAAYNAGPGAVDRYRGVPPFRETRAYVARVIREFNRRKVTLLAQAR